MPGDLLAEAVELLLGEPALQVRARVVARRGVALEVDEVAAVLVGRRVPEVVVADLVQGRQRLEGRDVAAELGGQLVRAHDHRHRVPANDRAQPPLERGSPGSFASRAGGIVFTYGVVMLAIGPLPASCARCDGAREDLAGAIGAVVLDDGIDGLEPLGGLDRIDVSSGAV